MLNVSKTNIMLIRTHQRLNAVDSFSVTEDNTSLERVDIFKHLGVIMDETLSWKEHVSSMGKKISSRLALLRRARKVLPNLLVLHCITRWYCPYFTIARSSGITVARVVNLS